MMPGTSIKIRKANSGDLALYFDWVNDPVVRANSINDKPISLENHTSWFNSRVNDSSTILFLFEIQKEAIGQVRFDKTESKVIIDYSISKAHRGKGFGKEILALAIEELRKEQHVKFIEGVVKEGNVPSNRVFNQLGFSQLKKEGGLVYYQLGNIEDRVVLVNSNSLHKVIEEKFSEKYNATIINLKEDLTPLKLRMLKPKFIFFPHWSSIIPESIFESYNCIVFHMTDLPYGRGGSPLQNLIVRGHKQTKISALKVVKEIDAGDIYLKKDLSLGGTAEQIFKRAGLLIAEMMETIIKTNPIPQPQEGEVVKFKRRKPADGNIAALKDIESVYDFIRMLDAEGYPSAFFETADLQFEFKNATLNKNEVIANVRIIKK